MLPVSYRASSVFYPQTDSFILFKDPEVTGLLATARRADLVAKLMKLYEFPGVALTHENIVKQLEGNGRKADAITYRQLVEVLNAVPLPAMKATIEAQLAEKRKSYEDQGLVRVEHQASASLSSQVEFSQQCARRYNPIRLAVEHDSFCSEVVKKEGTNPNLPAISILNPEVCEWSENCTFWTIGDDLIRPFRITSIRWRWNEPLRTDAVFFVEDLRYQCTVV